MNRPNWNEYYMNIASVVALRSPDPKLQVGAVLISIKNNKIISSGYNSTPYSISSSDIDFTNRDLVRSIIIHAEMNCLLYKNGFDEDCILYITHSCCSKCILLLAAAKIKKIYYKTKYKDYDNMINLARLFNIDIIQI